MGLEIGLHQLLHHLGMAYDIIVILKIIQHLHSFFIFYKFRIPMSRHIVSLFCMGEDARGVTIKGLRYTMENGTLTSGFPLGVSNHFTAQQATVQVRSGTLIALYDVSNGFLA